MPQATSQEELPQFETAPAVRDASEHVTDTPLATGTGLKPEKFTVKAAEPFCRMSREPGVISHEACGGCSVIVTVPQGAVMVSRLELTVTLAVFVPAVA